MVEHHGGLVTDVVGDGMTCVWTAPEPTPECGRRACLAALEIEYEVAAFNRRFAPLALPTRVGLNAGRVMVGNVGGSRRFAYSVVGDCVNTAARIEGLNKQRHRHPRDDAVVGDLPELLLRPLGRFLLVGKMQPQRLLAVVGRRGDPYELRLFEAFAEALARFEAERFADAATRFESILAAHPADGPTLFYLTAAGAIRRRAAAAGPRSDPPRAQVMQRTRRRRLSRR